MGSNAQTMFVGDRFETLRGGWCTIVDYNGSKEITVVFDNGYRTVTAGGALRTGKVKNRTIPQVCGVGYIGDGPHGVYHEGVKSRAYMVWNSMLGRCYDPSSSEYFRYGEKGVTVHEDWHNFQCFAEWYFANYFEGAEIDKDKSESSIYSAETCEMISAKENTILAHAVECQLVSPEGVLTDIYNVAEFAREVGVDPSGLIKVKNGQRNHCGGWTAPVAREPQRVHHYMEELLSRR